ncbi:hypothetical protein H6G64_00220 [Calothrix sp. FACHB-156]|nr:hypothetical protein [Nostoc linckia FACHB-104]MBD2335417.1 hypothetical protein [Calothrix sp. FACHB-156]
MSANEFLQQINPHPPNYLEINSARTRLILEQTNVETFPIENIDNSTNIEASLIVGPLAFLAMAVIVLYHKLKIECEFKELNISSDEYPCNNCRFFSRNKYLKCAVNPSSVLTTAAINCRDYNAIEAKKGIWWALIFDNKEI